MRISSTIAEKCPYNVFAQSNCGLWSSLALFVEYILELSIRTLTRRRY